MKSEPSPFTPNPSVRYVAAKRAWVCTTCGTAYPVPASGPYALLPIETHTCPTEDAHD